MKKSPYPGYVHTGSTKNNEQTATGKKRTGHWYQRTPDKDCTKGLQNSNVIQPG